MLNSCSSTHVKPQSCIVLFDLLLQQLYGILGQPSYNDVNIIAPSFLIGSSLFLQVARTTIKSRMSLKFGQTQPWTVELAALDQLKKILYLLENIQNILMTCWLSGERSLPFWLLVYVCVCVCILIG